MRGRSDVIYLDHAATCPMRPAALDVMTAALRDVYGNASPSYPPAQQAKRVLDQAKTDLAGTIGADWKEIFFTSGGTESDNWALTGAAEMVSLKHPTGHIITDSIEHHAILHTCSYLEARGVTVSYLPVDREGFVKPSDLRKELEKNPDTFLVSIMMANNEVGTLEPVKELVRVVRDFEKEKSVPGGQENRKGKTNQNSILFHTDAVQAYGKIPIDVKDLDVDLLSVSAHKIGGPKGIGFLFIRKGTEIVSLLHGGAQENGRRAGTENVPAAAGFAAAAKDSMQNMPFEQKRNFELQNYFYRRLKDNFEEMGTVSGSGTASGKNDEKLLKSCGTGFVWNGPAPGEHRLAGNVSISFPGKDQRALLMNLDLSGICASGGSACTTGAVDPSHVLMAMTGNRTLAQGTLRFTLGPENTEEEIDRTVQVLKDTLSRMASEK